MSKDFYSAIKDRRSIYGISKETVVPQAKIQEVINHAVMYTPSAFNSQSARVVVLFGENHDKLWNITKEALRKIVPTEKFAPTEEKINSFAAGYGTVLFFEDMSIITGLQEKFAAYKDNFPIWSQQASGMLQLVVWASLEAEGLGANLQHYSPLIDEDVRQQWNIPSDWKLIAQMPFGKPIAPAGEKQILPIEERVKLFK
jgi:predicted oxidoreductase (fatty acid repression mutant protein)